MKWIWRVPSISGKPYLKQRCSEFLKNHYTKMNAPTFLFIARSVIWWYPSRSPGSQNAFFSQRFLSCSDNIHVACSSHSEHWKSDGHYDDIKNVEHIISVFAWLGCHPRITKQKLRDEKFENAIIFFEKYIF